MLGRLEMTYYGRDADRQMRLRLEGSLRLSYVRVDWVMVSKRYGIYVSRHDQRVDGDFAIVFHDKHPYKPWLMDWDKFVEVTAETKNWRPTKNRSGHWHVYDPSNRNITSMLVAAPEGMEIDHDNRDPMDQRVANLVPRTRQQQCQNTGTHGRTSAFRGVSWHKGNKSWYALLIVRGVKVHESSHKTEIAAARAWVKAHQECPETAWMWNGEPYQGFVDPLMGVDGN
jgi:hypothetical protein